MSQIDGQESAPAASADGNYLAALEAEANAAFAALDDSPPQTPETPADAPAEASSETTTVSEAESAAPESVVDAELAGPDEDQITRRNARELVEKARAEAKEASERAAKAEQDKADSERLIAERQSRMEELANTWGSAGEHSKELERAIARNDWDAIDRVAKTYGLESPSEDDARALLVKLDEQHARNGEMADYWLATFKRGSGELLKKLAAETEGASLETMMTADLEGTFRHYGDAREQKAASEWKGKYDALKAEYDALRARAGALSPSPESGGAGASGGAVPTTVQELERMSLHDFDKNFDKILAAIPR